MNAIKKINNDSLIPVKWDENRNPVEFKTKDYDRFRFVEDNRVIYDNHVKDLARNIKDFSLCPIIVSNNYDGTFNVLDGQHRLKAASVRMEYVFYRVLKESDYISIPEMQTQRQWSSADWIHHWACRGNEDYQSLIYFCRMHSDGTKRQIPQPMMADLIHRTDVDPTSIHAKRINGVIDSAGCLSIIRNGKFKFKNKEYFTKLMRMTKDYPESIRYKGLFIRALCAVVLSKQRGFDEYDHSRMRQCINNYPDKIYNCPTVDSYIRMIEDLYNRNKKSGKSRFI